MGLSKKNLYVVPNAIVGQRKDVFLRLYPHAKLLCVEPTCFRPAKCEEVLERIRDSDFDAVIMAYSCFELIPLSRDYYRSELEEKKALLSEVARGTSKATSRLRRKLDTVKRAPEELCHAMDDCYDGVYFDELGITRLFVDEAHNFKNIPLKTSMKNGVIGLDFSNQMQRL